MLKKPACAVAYLCSYFFFQKTLYQVCEYFRLSQSHRMVMVGRDVARSPAPTPLLKQGHLESGAQKHVQMAFGHMLGWKHHNLPEQLAICQYHRKKPFLMFRGNLQCFSLSPLSLVFSPPKRAWLCPLWTFTPGIYTVTRSPSLLPTKQSQMPQPLLTEEMFHSFSHLNNPLLHSSYTEETRTGHSTVWSQCFVSCSFW